MRALWQNLGLILIVAGVATLAICFLTDSINNTVLGSSLAVILGGLVAYILINKRMGNWKQ